MICLLICKVLNVMRIRHVKNVVVYIRLMGYERNFGKIFMDNFVLMPWL